MIKNAAIQIAVKIKPTIANKLVISSHPANKEDELNTIEIKLPSDETQKIEVDLIHDANTSTNNIYENCSIGKFIGKFIEGYNIAILTYGQTGSGKTFALEGNQQQQGIIPRAIQEIYKMKTSETTIIKCAYIQLYNEKIADMFNTDALSLERGLKMRWEAEKQFIIEDLTEKVCIDSEHMLKQWQLGSKNRVISSNKIHDYSSRSHCVFMIMMDDEDEDKNNRSRQAIFVDLAGSQRIFSPVGRLSKEAIEINKSLFFLRKVISTLEDMNLHQKQQYIPYRDSKLTSILKKAFGGNCLTLLIACIHGHSDFVEQSLSTLQYAVSASKIQNTVNINIDLKSREIKELKTQNHKLKRQLQFALLQIQNLKSLEREQEIKRKSNSEYANRVIECIGTVRQLLQSNKELREQLESQKQEKKTLKLDLEELQKKYRKGKLQHQEENHISIQSNKAVGIGQSQQSQQQSQKSNIFSGKRFQKEVNIINLQPIVMESQRSTSSKKSGSLENTNLKRQRRSSSIIRRRKFMLHDKEEEKTPTTMKEIH